MQAAANPAPGKSGRGTADRRLLGSTAARRGYLVMTVAFELAGTGLILAQAGLLAHALAALLAAMSRPP